MGVLVFAPGKRRYTHLIGQKYDSARHASANERSSEYSILHNTARALERAGIRKTRKPPEQSIIPEPKLKRTRYACCSALMDAAKASHPRCVERYLNGWGRDELFQRSYARLPKPLHESAGAKLNRSI